jgi:hypothetical protein
VVLAASFEKQRGLVLMSSKLGDFKLICDRGFCSRVEAGDMVDFRCPVCSESLTSKSMNHFTELKMVDTDKPDQPPAIVLFSRVCDERATFVFDGDSVREYGEAARLIRGHLKIEGHWGW